MAGKHANPFRMAPLQELTVEPIDDPAELAVLENLVRQSRQKPAPQRWWLLWTGAAVVILLIGILIGRFVL